MKKTLKIIIASALIIMTVILGGCAYKPVKDAVINEISNAAIPAAQNTETVNVSPDAAIDIALKHAGISRNNAVMFSTPSLDENDGVYHYDIKFEYEDIEYDYEISVNDGKVLKSDKEAEQKAEQKTEQKSEQKAEQPAESPKKETTPKQNGTSEKDSGYISVETAKQKVLEDAGVKAADATFLKAYYDHDDILPHFEIKFEANGYVYEYEVKAADGTVLEKDIEKSKEAPKAETGSSEYITEQKAKTIAFDHASLKEADIRYSKAELDKDDMVVHYDIEFASGKYEYEYEINAKTGKILAFDKDFDD